MTLEKIANDTKAYDYLQKLLKGIDLDAVQPEELKRLMVAVYKGQDLFYAGGVEEK